MARVIMDTKVDGKGLIGANVIHYDGSEYVLIDDAYPDDNCCGDPVYLAYAVRLGDEITDGYAPLYRIEWDVIDTTVEDGSDACNWDNVANVTNISAGMVRGGICK